MSEPTVALRQVREARGISATVVGQAMAAALGAGFAGLCAADVRAFENKPLSTSSVRLVAAYAEAIGGVLQFQGGNGYVVFGEEQIVIYAG